MDHYSQASKEEDMPALHGKNPSWYASWLLKGLRNYTEKGQGRHAFPEAATRLEWGAEDIGHGLAVIGKSLPESDRQAFHAGVVMAFEETAQGRKNSDVENALHLLILAAGINDQGIIKAVYDWILTGQPGYGNGRKNILLKASEVVREVATQDNELSIPCLHRLSSDPYLPREERKFVREAIARLDAPKSLKAILPQQKLDAERYDT
jgi:hypothetical protein